MAPRSRKSAIYRAYEFRHDRSQRHCLGLLQKCLIGPLVHKCELCLYCRFYFYPWWFELFALHVHEMHCAMPWAYAMLSLSINSAILSRSSVTYLPVNPHSRITRAGRQSVLRTCLPVKPNQDHPRRNSITFHSYTAQVAAFSDYNLRR